MSDTEPTGARGTGEEQDWRDQGGAHGEPARPEDARDEPDLSVGGEPDIGTAGAFPALANDALPKDPDVPTDVDPGDSRRNADGSETDGPEGAGAGGPGGAEQGS